MKKFSTSRRLWLKSAAALGLLGPAGIAGLIQDALAKGDLPTALGINALSGEVTINGVPTKLGALVKAGDIIATGRRSSATIVIGKDAFLLRENTRIEYRPPTSSTTANLADAILVTTGKMLSVFGKRGSAEAAVAIRTKNATIGIRGTGCYVEIDDVNERTYFCLCYGSAGIDGAGMTEPKVITTVHHETPVWLDDRGGVMKVESAGFVNHTDLELIMLEKLQGREPLFVALGMTGKY